MSGKKSHGKKVAKSDHKSQKASQKGIQEVNISDLPNSHHGLSDSSSNENLEDSPKREKAKSSQMQKSDQSTKKSPKETNDPKKVSIFSDQKGKIDEETSKSEESKDEIEDKPNPNKKNPEQRKDQISRYVNGHPVYDSKLKIAQETKEIIQGTKSYYTTDHKYVSIKKQVENCIKFSKFIPEYENLSIPYIIEPNKELCCIEITHESTLSAAIRLIQKNKIEKTCALNFASATKPGGGWINGREAQEESITRKSALYETLTKNECFRFYEIHKKNLSYSSSLNRNLYTNNMIYSSRVPVIRDPNTEELLQNIFLVSFITCAAPNLKELKIDYENYFVKKRIDFDDERNKNQTFLKQDNYNSFQNSNNKGDVYLGSLDDDENENESNKSDDNENESNKSDDNENEEEDEEKNEEESKKEVKKKKKIIKIKHIRKNLTAKKKPLKKKRSKNRKNNDNIKNSDENVDSDDENKNHKNNDSDNDNNNNKDNDNDSDNDNNDVKDNDNDSDNDNDDNKGAKTNKKNKKMRKKSVKSTKKKLKDRKKRQNKSKTENEENEDSDAKLHDNEDDENSESNNEEEDDTSKNQKNAKKATNSNHDDDEELNEKKKEEEIDQRIKKQNEKELNEAIKYSYFILKERIRRILKLAIIKNNKAIVLGAFGCGVFENDPNEVARIFKELLIDDEIGYYFDNVVFGIIGSDKNDNYQSFLAAFKQYLK